MGHAHLHPWQHAKASFVATARPNLNPVLWLQYEMTVPAARGENSGLVLVDLDFFPKLA